MSTGHPCDLPATELLRSCRQSSGRSGGPGGQHRNKVETQITLEHRPSGISAQAGERRAQADNKRVALFRLRLALALGVRTRRTGPSALWRERSRAGRLSINPTHTDFPAMLAEALDVLAVHDWEPRGAAEALGCSATQLVKLLKRHPPALVALNERRKALGRHPLR